MSEILRNEQDPAALGALPAPDRRSRRDRRLAWAAAIVLLAGAVLWLGVDAFVVRSGSMEPLLHGDPETGDRLLVLRPYYKVFEPRRFDLVVFHTPLGLEAPEDGGSGLMVKRVVGLEGETIGLRDGDAVVDGKIIRKPRDQFGSVLIPVADWACGEAGGEGFHADEQVFRAEGPEAGEAGLLCDARARKPGDPSCMIEGPDVRDGVPAGDGAPEIPGETLVGDVRLLGRFRVLDDRGWIEARLQEQADIFRVRIGTRGGGGGVTLYHSQAAGTRNVVALDEQFGGLEAGRIYELDFFNIDDRVGVYLDGVPLLAEYLYPANTALAGGSGRNRPALGAPGGRVRFLHLRVERDVHWLARGRLRDGPIRVTDGHIFVLGDNSGASLDSRDPRLGDVALDQLSGRPVLVFYPLGRVRWL